MFHFTVVIIRQNNAGNVIFLLGAQGLLVATIGFVIKKHIFLHSLGPNFTFTGNAQIW